MRSGLIGFFAMLIMVCSCCTRTMHLDFWPDRGFPYVDSIEIEASLSDTTIQLSELNDMAGWVSTINYPYPTNSIYLTVRVKNTSGLALNIPKKSLHTYPCETYSMDETIVYIGGREGDSTSLPCRSSGGGSRLLKYLSPGYFSRLSAGAERVVADSVEVLWSGNYPLDKPGRYWVLVIFQNYAWIESKIPYWTGEVWSDTLWFNIVE